MCIARIISFTPPGNYHSIFKNRFITDHAVCISNLFFTSTIKILDIVLLFIISYNPECLLTLTQNSKTFYFLNLHFISIPISIQAIESNNNGITLTSFDIVSVSFSCIYLKFLYCNHSITFLFLFSNIDETSIDFMRTSSKITNTVSGMIWSKKMIEMKLLVCSISLQFKLILWTKWKSIRGSVKYLLRTP